jgi:hypothetical protein
LNDTKTRLFLVFFTAGICVSGCGKSAANGGGGAGAERKDPPAVITSDTHPADSTPVLTSEPGAPDTSRVGRPVTDRFGNPIVQEGEALVESKTRPWSAWWYPAKDPYLFQGSNGQLSPLEKFDQYVKTAHNAESGAVKYERDNLFDPNATGWEGLCNAWSVASLMEPEPDHPVTVGGQTFQVADLKAILVKTYENVDGLQQFGQRYDGARDSVWDDIYPDQFHRFLQVELIGKGKPFIMDRDPGIPVWNTPVWKADVRVLRDASDVHVMHVRTTVVGASPFVRDLNFVGTLPITITYTYDLYGQPRMDGSLEVLWGIWTGDSMDNHPDFVVSLPDSPKHWSENKSLDNKTVYEILQRH